MILRAKADRFAVDLILDCERAASRRNPRDCDPTQWSRSTWRRYLYAAAHAPSLVNLQRIFPTTTYARVPHLAGAAAGRSRARPFQTTWRNEMANYPAPREIPPGGILLCEYGSPDYVPCARSIVAERSLIGKKAGLSRALLIWSSPGLEPAGSVGRWTNGYWKATLQANDGSTHGRLCPPTAEGEAEARAHYARMIG
jgi:hypothetical protein